MVDADTQLLQQIEATGPEVEAWRSRLQSLFGPGAGSTLRTDDGVFPSWPPSQIVVTSLGTATHHLVAVLRLLATRELFPSVYSTITRAALVGAAQALWILSPESRVDRQGNALVLIRDELRHLASHSKIVRPDPTQIAPLVVADLDAHVAGRRAEVDGLLTEFGRSTEGLDTTNMVSVAAGAASLGPDQAMSVKSTWMAGSGAAHGRGWPMLTAVREVADPGTAAPGQMVLAYTSGDMRTIAEQYLGAHALTRSAWGFWDQRALD